MKNFSWLIALSNLMVGLGVDLIFMTNCKSQHITLTAHYTIWGTTMFLQLLVAIYMGFKVGNNKLI